MQAGKLRCRATLQRPSTDTDTYGQPLTAWDDVAAVWADIRHVSGIEAVKADAQASTVKASIRIRFRADVTAGMRVLYGAVAYDIKAVLPDPAKRKFIDLVCEVTQ